MSLARYIGQSSDANKFLSCDFVKSEDSPPYELHKNSTYVCSIRHTATQLQAYQLQVGSNVPEAVEQYLGSQYYHM